MVSKKENFFYIAVTLFPLLCGIVSVGLKKKKTVFREMRIPRDKDLQKLPLTCPPHPPHIDSRDPLLGGTVEGRTTITTDVHVPPPPPAIQPPRRAALSARSGPEST